MIPGWKEILTATASDFARHAPGFAFERKVTADGPIKAGSKIEDRLSLRGTGELEYFTRGSQTHAGGKEAGLYRATLPPDQVRAFLDLLAKAQVDTLDSQYVEPPSTVIALRLIGAGHDAALFLGKKDPLALKPLSPLFAGIAGVIDQALASPLWAVSLEAGFEKTGGDKVRVKVVFRNRGTEGVWLAHPAGKAFDRKLDFCRVSFAKKKPSPPGVTPIPMPPKTAPLEMDPDRSKPEEVKDLIWLDAQSETVLPMIAELPDNEGAYLIGADYGCFSGSDSVAGRASLCGAVYSKDTLVQYG